jgi:DNA-directed RNA polymerase specialized sigma24 family protein
MARPPKQRTKRKAPRSSGSARKLSTAEIENLLRTNLDARDSTPENSRQAEALAGALAKLPERRRAILVAVLQGRESWTAIAERLDVSVETIDAELRQALEQGLASLRPKTDTSDER